MTKENGRMVSQDYVSDAFKTHLATCPTAVTARNIEKIVTRCEHTPRASFMPTSLQGWLAVVIMVSTLLGFVYAGISWQARIDVTQEQQVKVLKELQTAMQSLSGIKQQGMASPPSRPN